MPEFNPFETAPGPTPPSQETTEPAKPRRGRPPKPAKRTKATKAKPARGSRSRKAQAPSNGQVLTIPQAVAIVRQIEGLLAPFDKDVRRHLMESVKV